MILAKSTLFASGNIETLLDIARKINLVGLGIIAIMAIVLFLE